MTTTLQTTTRTTLLAEDILAHFNQTAPGHCARVDYLSTTEATAICHAINAMSHTQHISAYVLTKQSSAPTDSSLSITVDRAIEIRNRKQETLCLFVPSDLVDAAYSSLANSFAVIDGRTIYERVLKRIVQRLSERAAKFVRVTFSQLRGALSVSDDQKMDFALAVEKRAVSNELDLAGQELWRVGLIADATVATLLHSTLPTDLERKLADNRRCALALSRPTRIDATTRERIQTLKVHEKTSFLLNRFFKGRSLNNVPSWSRDLINFSEPLTFDAWIFPDNVESDIRDIKIRPFVNTKGEVEKHCKLLQPDGAQGSLIARCAPKEKLVVSWTSEPVQPSNLSGWRISIVPADDIDYDGTVELPERDIPASRRSININMDIELGDNPPDFAVCVYIRPINTDGSVIVDEDGNEIFSTSSEFFLSKDIQKPDTSTSRESKFVVPNLAYGRIAYAFDNKDTGLEETEPQWSYKDLSYFGLKLNNRRTLQVELSPLLLELERQSITEPRKHTSYIVQVSDIHRLNSHEITSRPLPDTNIEVWAAFWKTRESFFARLKKTSHRDVIEIAEWNHELTNTALRYVQAYKDLLEDLLENQVDQAQLREALSIDSILLRIAGRNNDAEEAIVTLPIHPLRVGWLVSYTQLLNTWEEKILALAPRERKYNLDLQALRLLTPINVPPFAYHADTSTTFTFFQNLRFFHGVALPAGVPDPHRRYGDVAQLFGMPVDQGEYGDSHPKQLAEHLKNFLELHPYTRTLVTTLFNPDRGDFFAEALKTLLPSHKSNDDDNTTRAMPTFHITAYTDNRHESTLQSIELLRQNLIDQQTYKQVTDHFLPAITTTSRHISQLQTNKKLPESHIAVVTDLTRPAMKALPVNQDNTPTTTSFSLYGLVTRFISQFTVTEDDLRWQHRIMTESVRKPEAHPAGHRYSELLIELHTALLNAGGFLLAQSKGTQPVLEVILTAEQRTLLEKLHTASNWVVTLDRFFTLDYYDSPHAPGLDQLARKYVLDYAPEFTDGLGHRMMVTTAWHEEFQSLLSQAMNDLGFARVEQSVSHLLHHLKTISGRLALRALESPTVASTAVGLGVVTAWLEQRGSLRQSVLIPVDIYPRLFSLDGTGNILSSEQRCDLVLISLKRNIVEANFIKVKWRRGHVPFEDMAKDMVIQMKSTATIIRKRFFDENRIDGALQRSYLANILRFYFERSRRYKLFDPEAEASFLEHITRLEKTGLDFRPKYEGYIVNLTGELRKSFPLDDARITVLTASDFEPGTQFSISDDVVVVSIPDDTFISISNDETDEEELYPASTLSTSTHMTTTQISIPEDAPVVVSLGYAQGSNIEVNWQPAVSGSPHLFVLGIPGQGKSWTVTRILTELGRQQVPALVLDFHGQFADPGEPFVQAIHPHVLDAARGLPFSPFECTQNSGNGGWQANSYSIAEIFAHVVDLGDMQKDVVFSAIRDAYKAHGFSDDPDQSITHLSYPGLAEVLHNIETIAQARHVTNVAARCRPLLEMNLFRPTENPPDLLTLVRSGLVIDLHNLYVDTFQQAVGAFVLRKIYKDMFTWGYAKRIRLAIVLDEAHRLAKDVTLPKIMREGRKFGVAVIVASQGMADFHSDVLGTAGTKVIFRMNHPESKRVSGFIRGLPGQDLPARIEQLGVGTSYIQTPEMSVASIVNMHPLK